MTPETLALVHKAAYAPDRPWSVEEFAVLLDQPGTVVTGDERGFALARVLFDEAELLTIATHPDHRRQGIGYELMQAWQNICAEKGATRALLEVAADNTAARALYARCGYEQIGQRKGYYARADAPAVDAIVMSLPLT
ncbi:GNAT family N-acetyltransferase [Phaeobacter sp. 22II1-1F12B]|uniref:GNAT family N-acetyltransferase n=1 Tax=Phaeobacter sp. 22II1-1F12B TaxID=1317111 RepID=UPI000B5290B8|nr:GNAT family N-acetyltransferase [Phaeobacter sp. 22II1-1F12B]OWU78992.1 alanine acetyltransferase [Phaeobacter sp. 22II1-1F12B]